MRAIQRAVLFALILVFAWLALSNSVSLGRVAADKGEIERGRYLVEEVAKCAECHTPRKANGELDENAWLQGAPIWIMPARPIPNWAERAPALVGFPYTEEEGERVLEKGTGPRGDVLKPPMHIYHMKHEDAKAIIAYLNSLPQRIH